MDVLGKLDENYEEELSKDLENLGVSKETKLSLEQKSDNDSDSSSSEDSDSDSDSSLLEKRFTANKEVYQKWILS